MSKSKKTLIVIVGPTAIGKTELAITIAQQYQTEIISADSRQFFKEMNIGTAKPSLEELSTAKHHFINSHAIHDDINVGSFEKQALEKIKELFETHDVLVMAGGSGLYVNAVLYGFDEMPPVDELLRNKLNEEFANQGIIPLQEQLKELDLDYYQKVDIHNPQRIIRALEVCLSTGKTYSSFRNKPNKIRDFNTILIGLNTDREKLYNRINLRVDLMMKAGLLEEVKSLQQFQHLNALKTVGYTELFQYLTGKYSLDEAIEKLKQNTRNFAKRQLTWFKKNEKIVWFDPENEAEILIKITDLLYGLSQKRN